MNLIKEVVDLYNQDYKALMKKIEVITKNGKIYCICGLKEPILFKC
jgi:hypothetical protein